MTAYYNEIDPYAAQWLRNLIAAGHIAPGDVDERSIEDVTPDDLRPYTQCHFFAGIGVWSHALRAAGWPDSRPVWTGSCPCQPFSAAGKGGGFADERHLWPAFHHLIRECGPGVVFGEQVASKDGLAWLDLVQADLEGTAYASGAVDLCAAGVGSPHIRQRLWWCAERLDQPAGVGRLGAGRDTGASLGAQGGPLLRPVGDGAGPSGSVRGLADADDDRQSSRGLPVRPGRQGSPEAVEPGFSEDGRPGPTNGLWRDADWLFCRDGKWRPVESGTFPLAHGAASRVGRLRAYGNAIVAQAAQVFVEAYLDARHPVLDLRLMSNLTTDIDQGVFS